MSNGDIISIFFNEISYFQSIAPLSIIGLLLIRLKKDDKIIKFTKYNILYTICNIILFGSYYLLFKYLYITKILSYYKVLIISILIWLFSTFIIKYIVVKYLRLI